jgi:transposase
MLALMRNTELTDEQWQYLRPLLPPHKCRGPTKGRRPKNPQRHPLCAAHGMPLGGCAPRIWFPGHLLEETKGMAGGWLLGARMAQLAGCAR